MSNLGSITLNEIQIFEVNSDPSIDGLTAQTGSLAILTDGSKMFLKNGEGDTDWISVSPDSKQLMVLNNNISTTNSQFLTIPDLVSDVLVPGLYKFEFNGKISCNYGIDDIRTKITPISAVLNNTYANGSMLDLGNGTQFNVSSYGIFRVITSGTVGIQIKSLTSSHAVTLSADSTLMIQKL